MPIHHAVPFRRIVLVAAIFIFACFPPRLFAVSSAATFRPVNPEELKMTSEPAAPGAPAIILYRELYRDDSSAEIGREDDYYRIKVFTVEGRKYGDVEIPFSTTTGQVVGIHARTIKPDGSIVDFDGKVFTKSIVKSRGERILAKTFTLPAVEPGCVIEYYYTLDLKEHFVFDSRWIVSEELYTKAANFSLKPYQRDFYLHWQWQNMPPGSTAAPKQGPDQVIRLQLSNIPAFQPEDLMPPEDELKARVDFIYSRDAPEQDPANYWQKVGKRLNGNLESFIGKRKGMEEAVGGIVGPNDPPEVKLQKIYARVQQMRNTSYEPPRTEAEEKQAKEKPPTNVEEVWQRGFGNGQQLTWLYLALVRAAGFEAYGVWAADRERYFFNPNMMDSERLDSNLVLVMLNGKDIFCDPGAAFTPFGLLPWVETGIPGLKLDKKDSSWVQTLTPLSDQARIERRANLRLSETGDLEGTLTVSYTNLEAAEIRKRERNADEAARKSHLEEIVKAAVPAACEVKLTNKPDWTNPATPLVAEFDIKVPGWASGAGHHVLLPVAVFSARERHVFDHVDRVFPIYVDYPYWVKDDLEIQLPPGWQVSSLPPGWTDTGKIVSYSLKADQEKGKVHWSRTLDVNFVYIDKKYYTALRNYFQQVKSADDQQVILEPGSSRASATGVN